MFLVLLINRKDYEHYISGFKGFLAMQIYNWRQDMCRMLQNKPIELLKIAGRM